MVAGGLRGRRGVPLEQRHLPAARREPLAYRGAGDARADDDGGADGRISGGSAGSSGNQASREHFPLRAEALAFSTANPAPSSASRTDAATLQVASVAPGAASRPRCRSSARLPHRRDSSPARSRRGRSRPPRAAAAAAPRRCRRKRGSGRHFRRRTRCGACRARASASERASSLFVFQLREIFPAEAQGPKLRKDASRRKRNAAARSAPDPRARPARSARNDRPKPKPVSRMVKLRRPRQRPGRPLPCRKTCRACARPPSALW